MKILDKHAIIIQLVSLIIGLFIYISFNVIEANNFSNLICFFLIISFGISHGALDNLKGKKLINHFGYNDIAVNKPSDPFDPIKNALTYKGKTIIRFWRRNSIMFSLALDWAARPSYRLKHRELETM